MTPRAPRRAISPPTVAGALSDGFLPAAPAEGDCEWCDYRRVCGPYEETRVAMKPARAWPRSSDCASCAKRSGKFAMSAVEHLIE